MIKLNDWEKAFIERFVEYYNLYMGSSIRMQVVAEILSKEMGIDTNKVLGGFYSLLKGALSIDLSASEVLNGIISQELIENLKKQGFSYPVLKFKFPKGSFYKDIKFKDNLLYSRGEDGLVRFWIYYDNYFYFLKEIGVLNAGYGPYEVLGDYLYYALGEKLIVYNIKSETKITEKVFPYKIEALESNGDIVYVFYGKIKQGIRISDNEVVYDLADVYEKLPQQRTKIDINEYFVIVHEGQIFYAKENERAFSNIYKIDFTTENIVFALESYIAMKDNILYLYDFEKRSVVISLSDEVAFSFRNNLMISVDKLNSLKLLDLGDLKMKSISSINEVVYSIDFNENYVVVGSNGYLIVYKLRDKLLFKTFNTFKEYRKIPISKGNVVKVKLYDNYLFAYADDGVLKVVSANDFSELHTLKVNIKDFVWTGNYLILFYNEKFDVCKLNGQVQTSYDLNVSSYLIYNREVILGTKEGIVKFLNLNDLSIHKEYKVSGSEIKVISPYKKYILIVDGDGILIFTPFWEVEQVLSRDISKPIKYIERFDDYVSIVYENGKISTYHKDGSLKSQIKTKGSMSDKCNIESDLEFLAFENGYIVKRGNNFYGSMNYKDYIYFVDGYDIIVDDKYYSFYLDSSLFEEISLLNTS
ncbi:MAG: hypothetical protein RMJ38_04910 [candidate division WOR-3 bacterium]|nr:hypothetical protein [candidate division WOR-3 bacterium]MDW8150761.1 hypothetical protein [candidate division WOR-3 bacterium]